MRFQGHRRGPLKKCANRLPFKLAKQHNFLTFPRWDTSHCMYLDHQLFSEDTMFLLFTM